MGVKAPPAEYLWALSGGLLASSCCVLQLVFNAMSVGCAGNYFSHLPACLPSVCTGQALTIRNHIDHLMLCSFNCLLERASVCQPVDLHLSQSLTMHLQMRELSMSICPPRRVDQADRTVAMGLALARRVFCAHALPAGLFGTHSGIFGLHTQPIPRSPTNGPGSRSGHWTS